MMKFLAAVALVVFWTVFSFSIAVLEEPPAFLAYGFGAITGAGWVLLVLMHWVRQEDAKADRDVEIRFRR